ncbi:RING-H2 finger protein ATL1 [Cardamine amara subsp. amara]|uniref:RING-type E3 ubiquitin transferase n=1 Tax=Cardamine amara subsp. amara TaxID=228776 RepID=A0ABD0ZQD4_CARAN
MDLTDRRNPFNNLAFPPPPPQPTFTNPIFPRTSSSGTNFPILAVAVIGILATAFLLVSYYVFVIKCCLNWHQIDMFRRRRRSSDQNPLMIYTPHEINRGLDESVIRAIPIFNFKKRDVVVGGEEEEDQNKSSQECSVCLNEFQEDEKLRIIPNCCHVFHSDCIDIWLQGNANCPLCRTSVSCDAGFPLDLISSPDNTPPRNQNLESESDDDYVVIELGTSNGNNRQNVRNRDLLAEQERVTSDEVLTGYTPKSISPWPRKFDKKERRFHKVTSMGDECINIRGKNNHFGEIQPIRRSISMDSSADRQLYLAVQEAISRRNRQIPVAGGLTEDCSSSGGANNRVMKRCFFSFGSSKASKSSSILPVYLEP